MDLESAMNAPGSVDCGCFPAAVRTQPTDQPAFVPRLQQALATLERQLILETLRLTSGNQSKAARELGITERIMGLRVKKYGIDTRSFHPRFPGRNVGE